MDFDGGGENLPAEGRGALLVGQALQKKLDRLTNIDESLFDRLSLRLASLQRRALRVTPVLVLFD